MKSCARPDGGTGGPDEKAEASRTRSPEIYLLARQFGMGKFDEPFQDSRNGTRDGFFCRNMIAAVGET